MISALVKEGIERMKKGEILLIYDADDREGETDFVMPASFVTPKDVACFRRDAGGLICVAIHYLAAEKLGLPFISDILGKAADSFPSLRGIVEEEGDLLYDKRSSFSLLVNHRSTFTGITDRDRALTIRKIGEVVEKVLNGTSYNFAAEFRTPGHVPILRTADGLLRERRGQTELSVALAMLAGIPPAVVICEMLDSESGKALSKGNAKSFASDREIIFIEGKEIMDAYLDEIRHDYERRERNKRI